MTGVVVAGHSHGSSSSATIEAVCSGSTSFPSGLIPYTHARNVAMTATRTASLRAAATTPAVPANKFTRREKSSPVE
jgi:hypothetical protein